MEKCGALLFYFLLKENGGGEGCLFGVVGSWSVEGGIAVHHLLEALSPPPISTRRLKSKVQCQPVRIASYLEQSERKSAGHWHRQILLRKKGKHRSLLFVI